MSSLIKKPSALAASRAFDAAMNYPQSLAHGTEVVDCFRQAMQEAGIQYSGEIIADGRLHRFHIDGHKPGTRNGAYTLHLDGVPAGWFQDFKTGLSQTWRADSGRRLTRKELIAHRARVDEEKRQRELEQHNKQEQAAAKSGHLWNCARPASDDFRYLVGKNIRSHGARQLTNAIVLPLHDESGRLVNLQFITADGQKRFLTGGKKRGCYFTIGDLKKRILICEGFATGASLHEATGEMVIVAFDCGNLEHVARIFRQKYPNAEIVICGDNDLNGTGQEAANRAAAAVDGFVLIPETPGKDWNDIVAGGQRHG
nr:toprim domain-containing protein [Nitrosomonas nitrosa]